MKIQVSKYLEDWVPVALLLVVVLLQLFYHV